MIIHELPDKDCKIFEFDISELINLSQTKVDILDYKTQFKNSRESSIHTWHSGYFTHLKTNKFDELVRTIEDCANEIGEYFKKESVVSTRFTLKESWAIVYNKYGYTEEHSHFPLCYSAVCYVSSSNCPAIQFGEYTISVNTGKLLIFPGYLKHNVPVMLPRHGERIVYVGNLYPEFDYSTLNTIAEGIILDKNMS